MKRLIVGLGNPGEKYANTRHNIGFMFLDLLAVHLEMSWRSEKKFNSVLAQTPRLVLAKPQTYMNLSGVAVKRLVDYFGIAPKDLIVVHDDVDLEAGVIKYHEDRGSGGHHGVEDIIEKLGTQEFTRVRIGVGRPTDNKFDVKDYVLSTLSKAEQADLENAVTKFCQKYYIN